jgi:outer membrane lipoprotein-sorting protein
MKMPASIAVTPNGGVTDADAGPFGDQLELSKYDNVEYVGKEKVDDTECDVIKASKADSEYVVYLQADYRVRRTVGRDIKPGAKSEMRTDFRNYVVDAPLDPALFQFRPPKGATEMETPSMAAYEAKLVKLGKEAPKFTLPNPKGGQVSLTDLCKRNKAVLVNFWFYH